MLSNFYDYYVEISKRPDGRVLGRVPLQMDLEPAAEWTIFSSVRRGQLSPDEVARDPAASPIWHSVLGEPYVSGFRVRVGADGGASTCDFGTDYFASSARQASSYFVNRGELEPREIFEYAILALAAPAAVGAGQPPPFSVDTVVAPMPVTEGPPGALARQCTPHGVTAAEDIRVFVPQEVLEEAAEQTRRAGSNETGGTLVGHLYRQSGGTELFAEVAAQIPAKHVRSSITQLVFTPETWEATRAAIRLRAREETMLGWWHSHSYMKETCLDCESRQTGNCQANANFMSARDCHLHRTIFWRAYHVALVVSDSPCAGLDFGMYGWRRGVMAGRGFDILGDLPALAGATAEYDRGTSNRGGENRD